MNVTDLKLVLLLLVACGEPSSPAPIVQNTAVGAPMALPSDAALGVLAVAPVPNRDRVTWVPVGTGPFLVEASLREGKGPPPSWLAVDGAGAETRLTYGATAEVPYGCDGNHMTVTMLDGARSKLQSGLLWLRPVEQVAWTPKAVPITHVPAKVTAARRDFTIGPVVVELVRTEPKRGVVNVVWRGRLVHQMTIERHDMDGADNAAPLDFTEGGIAVPVPEAAWSFGDERALVVVFRVNSYEGIGFKTIVVNPETGRTVDSMAMYLYQCAF